MLGVEDKKSCENTGQTRKLKENNHLEICGSNSLYRLRQRGHRCCPQSRQYQRCRTATVFSQTITGIQAVEMNDVETSRIQEAL